MKLGVVLGGGGVRGAAHIGVLRELDRMGIKASAIAGTSSGALVAALYACECDWDDVEALACSITRTTAIGFRLPLRPARPALLNVFNDYIRNRSFEELSLPLTVSAFNVSTGQEVVFHKGPILPALRSSIALPGLFPPAKDRDGQLLVDGGVITPLPVRAIVKADPEIDRIIAVDVRGGGGTHRPTRPWRKNRWMQEQVYRALISRVIENDLSRTDVVLKPAVQDVQTLEFPAISRCIQEGVKAVRSQADVIRGLVSGR